jgi:hypothetical protein
MLGAAGEAAWGRAFGAFVLCYVLLAQCSLEPALRKPIRAVLPSGTLGEQNSRALVNVVNKLFGFLFAAGAPPTAL